MRKITRRCLSVLMVVAVVGAGTVAFVNLDQGPEPVQQYGAVQEGDAAVVTAAIGLTLAAAGAGATGAAIICYEGVVACQGDRTAEKKAEKHETKIELSGRAATTAQQTEVFLDSMDNTFSGAKSIARQEGMSAYWNAVDNGSSLSAAKAEGKRAVKEFYTVKLQQLANSWNMQVATFDDYQTIESNSGLPDGYVTLRMNGTPYKNWGTVDSSAPINQSVTAPDGTAVTFMELNKVQQLGTDPNGNPLVGYPAEGENASHYENLQFEVGKINDSYASVESPAFSRHYALANQIWDQNQQVQQGIETVANQTYQDALNGEINISEMLSANTIAREYSREGNDQAWAAVRLSQIKDVGLPENLDGIGTVTVKSGGETTTGLFLSKSNPSGGEFESGATYNATALAGGQYVVRQSGEWDEITGEFSLTKIEDPNGGSVDSITVRNPTTEATNITEWRERMDRLEEMRAEINARQEKLFNQSGDTGIGLPNLGGLPYGGAGVVVAVLALLGMAMVSRSN